MIKSNIDKNSDEIALTQEVAVLDAYGRRWDKAVSEERPLTIYLNAKEIVTLMTMGSEAYSLVLGYIKNQRLLKKSAKPQALDVQIDWQVNAAAIKVDAKYLSNSIDLTKKTLTSGCAQGSVYGDLLNDLKAAKLKDSLFLQSQIYSALDNLRNYNFIYRNAGAVHGCALLDADQQVKWFIEDVGRHNAADAIAGKMWHHGIEGKDKWFYTTGRLTSEMVIKTVQMGVPILLSRSGVTSMGVSMAKKYNISLIARAKGRYFIIYNNSDSLKLDVKS